MKQNFWKLNLWKLVIIFILFMLIGLIGIIGIYKLHCDLEPNKMSCIIWEYTTKLIVLPSFILGIIRRNLLPKSNYISLITAIISMIANLFYYYTLSCLIFYIIVKIIKGKK